MAQKFKQYGMMMAAFLTLPFVMAAQPVQANSISIETEAYEWVEESYSPEQVPEYAAQPATFEAGFESGLETGLAQAPLASFGPFHVMEEDRVELLGSIESGTPAQFQRLLHSWPNIQQIDMVDCPGTGDDEANFALARMIRSAGIATYVPDGGSVRSGGVELFLAGAIRSAAPGAEFAVHSWRDTDGLEPDDFAADDPVHMAYIKFYREMGMDAAKARAFYNLTNSVPHDAALYLGPQHIAAYMPLG